MKLPFSHYVKAHHISHAALCAAALVAAIVFFVVGAGVRLLVGPVSLGPLAGTLAQAVQTALPGITLKYDKAAIEWSRDDNRVNLVVLGARILDDSGKIVATAPKADIDLAAAAFLHGKIAVQRITLVGVQLKLVHMKNGGIRLGAEGDKANDVFARLNDVIEAKGSSTSTLKSFAVHRAHLVLFDEVTGLNLTAPLADLGLTARGDDIGIAFNADIDVSGRPAHVRADLLLPSDTGPVSGSATVTHLDLAALGANAPFFRPLRRIALATDLSARFTAAPGGHLSRVDFDMDAAGDIPVAALTDKALHVRRLRLSGHYDGVKNHLALGEASLEAREANLVLKGGADFHRDVSGALDTVVAELSASRAALALPGMLPAPVTLQSALLRGTWHAAARSFDVERFTIAAPALALDVKGSVTLGETGQAPGLMLSGRLAAIPVRTLLRYWPLQAAHGARDWIDRDVFAGTLGPLTFETHLLPGMLDQPILPDAALTLTFPMSGIEGNYITGLTHVTGLSGSATLSGDSFTADFGGGKVGTLAVSQGHALIPSLHTVGTVGQFSAHLDGPMPDIMTLIDMKPLGYPTRFGVDPDQTHGIASVDLSVKVPMLAEVKVDDVGILVKAGVQDFAVSLGRLHLQHGDVDFTIDNNQLHQTGTVMLADSRLAVDWTEDFKTQAPITTRLAVKGELTGAGRAALNMGLATILTGPMTVTATLEGHRGQLRSADAAIDLTTADILIPIIHLQKPAGQAAAGHVTMNFGPGDNISDETIRLTGPTLAASGTANFDRNGALTVLNFPSVKMGPLNDLSFNLTRAPTGDTYTLRGHSMDGSLVGRNGAPNAVSPGVNASTPPDETPAGAFHIDAKLDRVAMRDGVSLAPFSMDLSGVGNRPGALALSASLVPAGSGKPAPLTATIETTPAGRKMTVNAGDAGSLIRGMFAFESLRGGKLTMTATLPGRATDPPGGNNGPDYQGLLDIDNFTMVNQPFFSRLFSAGSLTGIGDLMGGDGITIENLDVPFGSKNDVISVHGARARGPAIGATADGYIDRPKNLLALKGSLVPAYGLNSVLGNIPLLGDVLVSKKGEGIFGVTYSATGNADQPQIDVNPLSVLTPGILRRIFEGHMPTAANAPSNKPGAATAQSGAATPAN